MFAGHTPLVALLGVCWWYARSAKRWATQRSEEGMKSAEAGAARDLQPGLVIAAGEEGKRKLEAWAMMAEISFLFDLVFFALAFVAVLLLFQDPTASPAGVAAVYLLFFVLMLVPLLVAVFEERRIRSVLATS
jgi:uncharacterized membrane protein YtjA (UPF0391 family)